MQRFDGQRVAVVGLGAVANPPLVEFLVERGATVTACDKKTAEELGEVYERLSKLPIDFQLGEGYLKNLTGYDTVYLTPAIRRDIPEIVEAKRAGVAISSEILLFVKLCKAKIIGITGSSGKTTTTTVTGEIFQKAGKQTYVAGNIGVSLIKEVENIPAEAWVVLELSSFQLQDFDISPHISLVTNITPNHLDYHPTMEEYAEAKSHIFLHHTETGISVFNADDPLAPSMAEKAPGRVLYFSGKHKVEQGCYVDNGMITAEIDGVRTDICRADELKLPGLHNLENMLAASCIGMVAGLDPSAMASVFRTFRGVSHRLEYVKEINSVDYYNDSIATSPHRTTAALLAFNRPIHLIAGGYDKKLPFDGLAELMPGRVKNLFLIGTTAPLIRKAVETANGSSAKSPVNIVDCKDLDDAVAKASDAAQSGEVILLSPACASYDMFRNFEERGMRFKELVLSL